MQLPACFTWLLPVASAALAFGLGRSLDQSAPQLDLGFNEDYVSGLYSDLDLEDVDAVFGYIFSNLPERAVVYPSEGYYYFNFPMRGSHVRGTILLESANRDAGVLEFGYVSELKGRPSADRQPLTGRSKDYGIDEGLVLERLSATEFSATYGGREVTFELFRPEQEPPSGIYPHEEYLATVMDESGLQFDLIWDGERERLFWALDRGEFIPENFLALQDGVRMGARTRFVFFDDRGANRMVLIGVDRAESASNTWYDGPFDQGPDLIVDEGGLDLRDYLGRHTGIDMDLIDAYGHYVDRPGVRLPVAPFRIYSDTAEFDIVEELLAERASPQEIIHRFTL